ncbi:MULTISPECIES: hypothetical protein [unclassified Luteimonas]
MQTHPWQVAALAAIALPALWLLLAGPERLLGIEGDHIGMVLLVTAAWTSLLALSKLPRGEGEAAIAPAEWRAWIGTGFMAVAVAYFVGHVEVFAAGPDDRAARAMAGHLVLLLVAWTVLSQVLASRWKGAVDEDERDRGIAVQAAGWWRGTAAVAVLALAVTLGFSPPERLQWATHFMVANLLVLALMCAWLAECAATAMLYLRDRQ